MHIVHGGTSWLLLGIAVLVASPTALMANWCTKMGRRAYQGIDNETLYMTKIEKFCCTGFALRDGECKPICTQDCPNGVCQAPGQCLCNKGYILDDDTDICIPHCSKSCGFGKCLAPEQCECDAGYHFRNATCQPLCEPSCPENGHCQKPNMCGCNQGYSYRVVQQVCEPICNRMCINSFCYEPEKCKCYLGFSLLPNSSHNCAVNVCAEPCLHGYCDQQGQCICQPGYTKSMGGIFGESHCEEMSINTIKWLCIILSVVLVLAFILIIMVKICGKGGAYEPKKNEEALRQRMSKL